MDTALKSLPLFDTVTAFEAWYLTRPEEERYELIEGVVVAMAAERLTHVRLKHEVSLQLTLDLRQRGVSCEYLPDGMATAIGRNTRLEPDGLVACGDLGDGNRLSLEDAVIVVEVLSPSTASRDPTTKLEHYFRLPSLAHYLVFDALEAETGERPVLVHYRRHETADGISPIVTIRHGGTVALDPPGLSLDLDRVFATVA